MSAPGGLVDRVRSRLDVHSPSSLTRSGYALLISSVITSVLGAVYWLAAARLFDADTLGKGTALVSAVVLVTSLATAGLKRGLMLFVGLLRSGLRRFVLHIYAVGVAVTVVFGVGFLAGFGSVARELGLLDHHWFGPLAFLAAAIVWAVFVLQDPVLIGARRTTMVPISNAAFSLAKIVLLVGLAWVVDNQWGVLLSWVIPALGTAVFVNWWLFRRGLQDRHDGTAVAPPTVGQVVRFTGAEYVAAVSWLSAVYLTPLLVLARAGAVSNAHFYLAMQAAYALFLVGSNISDALVADAADAPEGLLAAKVRRASRQMAMFIVPGVVGAVVAAPLVMSAFGPGYRAEATTALRLLALAAVPNTVTTVMVAIAHVRRRMGLVMVIETTMAALTLGLSWLLIGSHGIGGVALAWLVAQGVTAVLAVVLVVRSEAGFRRDLRQRLLGWATSGRDTIDRSRSERLVPMQLAVVPEALVPPGPRRLLSHQHDLAVVLAGEGTDARVVRVAVGSGGRDVIAAHRSQLDALAEDPRLAPLLPLVPRVVQGDVASRWLVESACTGTPGSRLAAADQDRAVVAGLGMLEQLHSATARQVLADEQQVADWVHDPIAIVARVIRDPRAAAGLSRLHHRLANELRDRPVTVARLHGDVSLDNLLFTPHGAAVSGIVDWESSGIGLPELDLIALILSRRARRRSGELGEEILDLLIDGWEEGERELVGAGWSVNAHVRPTTLVLLTWLAHVAANLEKAERYRRNRWWIRHNVEQVLAALVGRGVLEAALDADPLAEHDRPILADPSHPRAAALDAGPAPMAARWAQVPLALPVGAVGGAAVLAHLLGAPIPVRIVLVSLALVVAPALVLGRRVVGRSTLARAGLSFWQMTTPAP
ncbi:MAG: hypothetical protein JWM05_1632, partial [Acidimicrobiales bacterium]|nr:hypothetical protein [Acidimicrobiales bacterium]